MKTIKLFTSPKKGDLKDFYGKQFKFDGSCWILDEVCNNVIDNKHSGTNKPYGLQHPVNR